MIRTEIFYVLSETNDLLNQILNELNKRPLGIALTDKKYPSKKKNWVTFDLSINLRKLLDSKKFTKEEFEYIALEEALNKIEAIPEKKKRIEILSEIRVLYQKELKQKEKELREKIDYNTSLKDRLKCDKSGGMLKYGEYDDLK
jgi:hypothetical protein